MAEQLSFKVAQVEGPLDLILQLISKHKLNIYDIEITKLLEQYMDYIQQVQSQSSRKMGFWNGTSDCRCRQVFAFMGLYHDGR